VDPRLQPLADVLVKVLVREILDEKSHRCGEMQNGGSEDMTGDNVSIQPRAS